MSERIIHASDLPSDVISAVSVAIGKLVPSYTPAEYLATTCNRLGLAAERDLLVDAIADVIADDITIVS